MKRPASLIVLATLHIFIGGCLAALMGLLIVYGFVPAHPEQYEAIGKDLYDRIQFQNLVVEALLMLIGLSSFASGIGLIRRAEWGRKTAAAIGPMMLAFMVLIVLVSWIFLRPEVNALNALKPGQTTLMWSSFMTSLICFDSPCCAYYLLATFILGRPTLRTYFAKGQEI
jgi:accessory gene regulator protein AgrB